MIEIYSDSNLRTCIDNNTLFENKEYFISFGLLKNQEIKKFLERSKLENFINWIPGNQSASLKITNYIGKIRLFDRELNVQSTKFLENLNGTSQLELIVNELDELTSQASYSYFSPSMCSRNTNWDKINDSDISEANYLYQVFCLWPPHNNIRGCIEKIIQNPNFKHEHITKNEHVWKTKKINSKMMCSFSKSQGDLVDINELRSLDNSSLKRMGHITKIPLRSNQDTSIISIDTQENRFIKFFLKQTEILCLKLNSQKPKLSNGFLNQVRELSREVQAILGMNFFREIGEVSNLGHNSTVLQNRSGYRDIYEHFIKSKFSISHIFQSYLNELTVDLKDIATLYEMWCFYKVASSILGDSIKVTENKAILENGDLKYSTKFENPTFEVSYNQTFSRTNNSCYSITLRPDITVMDKQTNSLFHFDAKYKNNPLEDNSKSFKTEDIQKMHTYVDAIYNTKSSIVLYPGNIFKFYSKDSTSHTSLETLDQLSGVGALPLVPGSDNIIFDSLIDKFFNLSN